jgi:hypothetical protein
MDVFNRIPRDARVIVATAVWPYSHHLLAGLRRHRGAILTVANWSGQWPGLVGLLNLNGSLTKAGVRYETLWSETFDDPLFTAVGSQGRRSGSGSPPRCAKRWRSSASSMRGAWGCTTASSTMSC